MKPHAFLFCLLAGISSVFADAKTWVGSGTSAWSTPENWEPSGAPTSIDSAEINNGGLAEFDGGSTSIGSFQIGSIDAGSGGWLLSSGTFQSDSTRLGNAANSYGEATVNNGTWQNLNELHVGAVGTGLLNLYGGDISNTFGFIGSAEGSSGTAFVYGGTWHNSVELYVGESGTGTLNMSGGLVTSDYGYLGTAASAKGTAIVSGGTWANANALYVGYLGTGTLTVTGDGVVSANSGLGNVILADQADSVGTLNIGNGGVAGTLQAAEVVGGQGLAKVAFNHTGTTTFSTRLAGNLSVTKDGSGTTVLTGSNSHTGNTTINEGILEAGNDNALGSGQVIVEGGVFAIQNDVAIANAVILSGGSFQRNMADGQSLTNALNSSSSFVGGTADTAAALLGGTLSNATTLASSFSPTTTASNDFLRISDAYQLAGTGSDIFVLELSLSTGPGTYLGWINDSNQWVNSIEGNSFNTASGEQMNYGGSFADFQELYGTNLALYVGAYGVDTATGAVWAVLDHEGTFAIANVPEPTVSALTAMGIFVTVAARRRRQLV